MLMDEPMVDFDAPMSDADMMRELIRELKNLAFSDIGELYDEHNCLKPIKDMPQSIRRAIAAIEIDEIWTGTGPQREQIGETKKIKLWDKKGSIDSFMKHLGMFIERLEIKQQVLIRVEQVDLDERIAQLTHGRN